MFRFCSSTASTTDKPGIAGNRARGNPFAVAVILGSIAIVLFWQIMGLRIAVSGEDMAGGVSDFSDYIPEFPGYSVSPAPVSSHPAEPNIVAYVLHPERQGSARAFVRLAYGYNLRDCMRYKNYEVELIEDTTAPIGNETARVQVWRLTDTLGEQSLWITSMLRASDFAPLDIDTRAMPFPSIGVPVDPGWSPRGLTLQSLRHPVRSLRMFMRLKWNNARRDPATFLGLRRPAWASAEVLTLVTGTLRAPDGTAEPIERRNEILSLHLSAIEQFINLGVRRSAPPPFLVAKHGFATLECGGLHRRLFRGEARLRHPKAGAWLPHSKGRLRRHDYPSCPMNL